MDGRALALDYIYGEDGPFVLPEVITPAEASQALHGALHYAQMAENFPWQVGGDVHRADEVIEQVMAYRRRGLEQITAMLVSHNLI